MQHRAINGFQHEMEAHVGRVVVAFERDVAARPDFDMHVAALEAVGAFHVVALELHPVLAAVGQHPAHNAKGNEPQKAGPQRVGLQQPPEAHARGHDGHNLGAGGELGRHENHGNEYRNGRE